MHERAGDVVLTTSAGELCAAAVVLAVPVPALRGIVVDPPPGGAVWEGVQFGRAVKVAVSLARPPAVDHRLALGGRPLQVAWCTPTGLAGIGMNHDRAADLAEMRDDLLDLFSVPAREVRAAAGHDWTHDPFSGGTYVAFAPGQLARRGPGLRRHRDRVAFAAAESSSWPDSMEGALEAAECAAAHVRPVLRRPP